MKFWGVRGSLPAGPPPHMQVEEIKKTMQVFFDSGYSKKSDIDSFFAAQRPSTFGGYGVATTCAEVVSAKSQIILDAGSGIKRLGDSMLKGPCGRGQGKAHIFMTHFHWDHVIGLPFFVPIFIPGNELHFYSVQPELEMLIRGLFKKPYFPVPFEALGAKVHFHVLQPRKPFVVDDMTIIPYMLDHPDPCWGYKISSQGKVYSHCVDTEGIRSSRESLGEDLPLYQGVDLMYYDAQYTLTELAEKLNWGHSAAQIGLDIAMREGIKKVAFAHHDPGAGTKEIVTLEEQTRQYYNWKLDHSKKVKQQCFPVEWLYAFEELVIEI